MKSSTQKQNLAVPVNDQDHIRGAVDAPVTLVEYGDYECPHCAVAHEIVTGIMDMAGDRVRYVYRNFPLVTMHPHAARAAEAAEAADAQHKYWDMHDLLFVNQNLEDNELFNDAQRLRLDLNRFDYDLRKHKYMPRVEEDFRSGVRSGVSGTPVFFINGIRYQGGYDEDSLLEAILMASQSNELKLS
jgi:protein-disulfide isomerase